MAFAPRKICLPFGWPYQLPFIAVPAIASARFGTGPRADCKTTPSDSTNFVACLAFTPVVSLRLTSSSSVAPSEGELCFHFFLHNSYFSLRTTPARRRLQRLLKCLVRHAVDDCGLVQAN